MKNALTPHITEKSYQGISEDAKGVSAYTFKVAPTLTKEAIRRMVEQEFKVTVTDVRTINLPSKRRRFRGIPGTVSGTTKAVVRLKKGDRIAAFDVEEKKTEDNN